MAGGYLGFRMRVVRVCITCESVFLLSDMPRVYVTWLAIILFMLCMELVVSCSGIVCSLYSAAEVAHHLRICLSIVIERICGLDCNITLCIVVWVVRTAAPLRLCGYGISGDKWTPSNLW